MHRDLNVVARVAGVALFALGVVMMRPAAAFAQLPAIPTVPVKVTNTPSVTVSGTPTVTVANTAVNPVPVTGTVQVTGLPAVQISGTPTVQLAGASSVSVTGTPDVRVVNQPGAGTIYSEVLFVNLTEPGSVAGAPGIPVPAGKRRIVTTVSAEWTCAPGHMAYIQLFANGSMFLPGQLAVRDAISNFDLYTSLSQVNYPMGPGQAWTPIMGGDGGHCLGNIFLSGLEVDAP
jgi:hypothetical protein